MNISILVPSYGENVWKEMAETRALPSAYAQKPHEVLIGHDAEGTVSSVRNGLAEKAVGEWLCFLDADDELAPGFLVAMQRVYERRRRTGGVPPLLTPAVSYVRKGKRMPARFPPGHDLTQTNFLVVGTLVERNLFLSVGGFSEFPHGYEDWSLWAKCWKAGAQIIKVKRAVYIAHINPNSKHRVMWRDKDYQVAMHEKVRAELFPELV